MCKPAPQVTAGAVLMGALCTKTGLAAMAVAGSGVALYAVAGTALNAGVIMALFGLNAILMIGLLVKRANPVRQAVPQSAPARMPVRTTIRLEARRTVPALTQAAPTVHELTHTSAPTVAA